jgi:hypothetical protein
MDILIIRDNFHTLMDIVIVDLIHKYGVTSMDDDNTCNDDGYSIKRRHDPMPNEHPTMISFPLLLKCMGVFVLILIHY